MKRTILAFVGLAIATVLTGCGGGSGDGSSDGDIKLGAWYPLTGPVAASGIPQEAGTRALIEAVNANGGINGKKIDYITRDNSYDPQQTLQVARRLIAQDKVVGILTPNGTAQSEAAFPYVLEQSEVPIFGTYGGLSTWYNPPREGLFGTQALYEDQATAAADWAIEEGAENVVIVRSDPGAFATVAGVAEKRFKREGVKVDTVVSKFGSTDYGPYVSEVKGKSPDAVLLILAAPEGAAYLKEAALQKVDVQTYGYSPTTSDTLLQLAGEAAEGFRGVSLTIPASDTDVPEVQEFRDRLKKTAPDVTPSSDALVNYASAMVFTEILKTIDGEITSGSITDAVLNAQDIKTGLLPPMSFSSENHLGTHEVVRVEVKDGEFASVGGFVAPKD